MISSHAAHRGVHQLQSLHDGGQPVVVRGVQWLEGKLVISLAQGEHDRVFLKHSALRR